MFYPRKYKVYGIGKATTNQFGLKQEYEERNEEYYSDMTRTKWHYLSNMSSLCHHPSFVFCGNGNLFLRNMKNEIYGIGLNLFGSLGVDSQDGGIENFTKIKFKDSNIMNNHALDIVSEGALPHHTFVVLTNINNNEQIFYGFGRNASHQQGYKSEDNRMPTNIPVLDTLFKDIRIIRISAGYQHTLFLTRNGRIYSCGANFYGQCGIATQDNLGNEKYVTPQMIPFLYNIINISSGEHHNLCLDKNNAIWVFGQNNCYQLGLGEEYKQKKQIATAIINPYFKTDSDDKRIVFIDCGDNHSLCITQNGKVYMFGNNDEGQCGNGTIDNICVPFYIQSMEICKDVLFESGSCGYNHTVLISYYPHNTLYGFGDNGYHQTGNIQHVNVQKMPYLSLKSDIGIDENAKIVRVICDDEMTMIVCET